MMALVASSKNVLVPDDWRGGGERAVLEARACGATVLVAEDNPKLQSPREGPLYTTLFYAGQLELGLLRSRRPLQHRAERHRRRRRRARGWRRLLPADGRRSTRGCPGTSGGRRSTGEFSPPRVTVSRLYAPLRVRRRCLCKMKPKYPAPAARARSASRAPRPARRRQRRSAAGAGARRCFRVRHPGRQVAHAAAAAGGRRRRCRGDEPGHERQAAAALQEASPRAAPRRSPARRSAARRRRSARRRAGRRRRRGDARRGGLDAGAPRVRAAGGCEPTGGA